MKYMIASEKVGIVGEEFVPVEGINIEALLEHGFIVSDKPASKPAKTKEPIKE